MAEFDNEHFDARSNKRACDLCRRRKIKCLIQEGSSTCDNCTKYSRNCSFLDPILKRGPKPQTPEYKEEVGSENHNLKIIIESPFQGQMPSKSNTIPRMIANSVVQSTSVDLKTKIQDSHIEEKQNLGLYNAESSTSSNIYNVKLNEVECLADVDCNLLGFSQSNFGSTALEASRGSIQPNIAQTKPEIACQVGFSKIYLDIGPTCFHSLGLIDYMLQCKKNEWLISENMIQILMTFFHQFGEENAIAPSSFFLRVMQEPVLPQNFHLFVEAVCHFYVAISDKADLLILFYYYHQDALNRTPVGVPLEEELCKRSFYLIQFFQATLITGSNLNFVSNNSGP